MRSTGWMFLLMVIAVVMMTGCTGTEEVAIPAGKIEEEVQSEAPVKATLLQGSSNGLWYMLAGGLNEGLNRSYPGSSLNVTPGDSMGNVLRLNGDQTDLAFIHAHIAYVASLGRGDFTEKQENLRGIAGLYPSFGQLFLLEETGITSFEEFFDRQPALRISVGSKGGSAEEAFVNVLEAYGLTVEDLEAWGCTIEYKNQNDTSKMFSDGALDGFFLVASAPHPMAVESGINRDLRLLQMGMDKIRWIEEEFGYSYRVIPATAYEFLEEDIHAISTVSMLAASKNTPDETVYKVTKAILDNLGYFQSVHVSVSRLTPEFMRDNLSIPMHPGAEAAYREKGLILE